MNWRKFRKPWRKISRVKELKSYLKTEARKLRICLWNCFQSVKKLILSLLKPSERILTSILDIFGFFNIFHI